MPPRGPCLCWGAGRCITSHAPRYQRHNKRCSARDLDGPTLGFGVWLGRDGSGGLTKMTRRGVLGARYSRPLSGARVQCCGGPMGHHPVADATGSGDGRALDPGKAAETHAGPPAGVLGARQDPGAGRGGPEGGPPSCSGSTDGQHGGGQHRTEHGSGQLAMGRSPARKLRWIPFISFGCFPCPAHLMPRQPSGDHPDQSAVHTVQTRVPHSECALDRTGGGPLFTTRDHLGFSSAHGNLRLIVHWPQWKEEGGVYVQGGHT